MELFNISWVTSPKAFWILAFNSSMLLAWLTYTFLFIYPHRKKSHGVRCGNIGCHLKLLSVSASPPTHLLDGFQFSPPLIAQDQCEGAPSCMKINWSLFGSAAKANSYSVDICIKNDWSNNSTIPYGCPNSCWLRVEGLFHCPVRVMVAPITTIMGVKDAFRFGLRNIQSVLSWTVNDMLKIEVFYWRGVALKTHLAVSWVLLWCTWRYHGYKNRILRI